MSNSLDPDQAQHFVRPDLDPNCLQRLSADSIGKQIEKLHCQLAVLVFTNRVCFILQVYNFLPSISSAIGGFTPQRYVWRICIALHTGLRFLLVGCYYQWLSGVNMGLHKVRYQQLVKVAILCHIIENLALVTLTCVSSTENFGKFENFHEGLILGKLCIRKVFRK